MGYLALIDNTKVTLRLKDRNVSWFPVSMISDMDLAFDHKYLFHEALKALQRKVKVEPIVFELLPDYFTLSQLQKLYEAVLGTSFDKRNFRKKVAQMHYVIPLKKKRRGCLINRHSFISSAVMCTKRPERSVFPSLSETPNQL